MFPRGSEPVLLGAPMRRVLTGELLKAGITADAHADSSTDLRELIFGN